MIKLAIFFCILPQYHGQDSSEWPWSEAIVEHTNLLGSYPKGHHPNLATVVQHGSEAYRLNEWGWDQKEWIKTLIGTVGEVIMIACRKVEGYRHEKASSITIAGNFLEADGKNYLYIPTAELCPTKKWNCTKQSPLTLCCRQEYVAILFIMNWRMMKRLTRLTSIINAHNLADILSPMDIPKTIDTRRL
ncbi:hypothetical protein DUI87_01727 [Hirundo rustica rustica]|uniref:Uncharacterized protein n=1 Tax=Hirundo rustica rustica TaxID=333673 RepID=A0A3M0LA93_HIRRU|nr:hypothetical protein DUI87_01727 [Hirundo rustica rustica]